MNEINKSTHKTKKNKLSLAMLLSLIGALLFAIPTATSVTAQESTLDGQGPNCPVIGETTTMVLGGTQLEATHTVRASYPDLATAPTWSSVGNYQAAVPEDTTTSPVTPATPIGFLWTQTPPSASVSAGVIIIFRFELLNSAGIVLHTVEVPQQYVASTSDQATCKQPVFVDELLGDSLNFVQACPGKTGTKTITGGMNFDAASVLLKIIDPPIGASTAGAVITFSPPSGTSPTTINRDFRAISGTSSRVADIGKIRFVVYAVTDPTCTAPTPDATLLDAITDISVCPGKTITRPLGGSSDFAPATAIITLTNNPDWLTINDAGAAVTSRTITAAPSLTTVTSAAVTVTVDIRTAANGGKSDSETFDVTVVSPTSSEDCLVDDSGLLNTIQTLSACPEKSTTATLAGSSRFTASSASVTLSNNPSWVTVNAGGTGVTARIITATPPRNEPEGDTSPITVTVRTHSTGGRRDAKTFIVKVLRATSSNDCLVTDGSLLNTITAISVCPEKTATTTVSGGLDYVVGTTTLTPINFPSWLSLNTATGVITAAPPRNTAAGDTTVMITARTDATGGRTDTKTFTATVVSPTSSETCLVTDATLLNTIPVLVVCPEKSTTATLTGSSSAGFDASSIMLTLASKPNWVTGSGASITAAPPAGQPAGDTTITVIVRTHTTGGRTDSGSLTVRVRPITDTECETADSTLLNTIPVLSVCPEKTASVTVTVGAGFDIATTMLSLVDSTRSFIWISISGATITASPPRSAVARDTSFLVTARTSATGGKTDSEPFTLRVLSPTSSDDCLVTDTTLLNTISDFNVCPEGSALNSSVSITLSGFDVATDMVMIADSPDWVTLSGATITATPTSSVISGDMATVIVDVRTHAVGMGGRMDSEEFVITVVSSANSLCIPPVRIGTPILTPEEPRILDPDLLAKLYRSTCTSPDLCLYSLSAQRVVRGRSLTG